MIRIRRVPDGATPANAQAIAEAQAMLRSQFADAPAAEFADLADNLRDPLTRRLRTMLFVAEDARDRVRGCAVVCHAPDLQFCFLEYVAVARDREGGGYGGALYDRVRQEALALGCVALFFECGPDDPALSRVPAVRRQNETRLRFYERYGAFPVANTKYETPLKQGGDDPPYLMIDGLGRGEPLALRRVRPIVRAILERKYGAACPPGYIDMVVQSFRDDPVALRRPRPQRRAAASAAASAVTRAGARVPLIVNQKHDIHHVRDRGYVEAPVRVRAILSELMPTQLFAPMAPRRYSERWIRAVHDSDFVDYLQRACKKVEPGRSIYPYVFPIRNQRRPPKELPLRAGYFCMDTFTPLNANAYLAARRAVDCALTAADMVLAGKRFAYALVRPPGHHAERRIFGGFCYFNNAAVAAHYLSQYGRVAVLDVDYHHGNGTQYIFYDRRDVLTVSIHGHPSFAYPYFSGFAEERGEGAGEGFNLNLPLPEKITATAYRDTLARALRRVRQFAPAFLVVSLGFDTGAGDPTGSWPNRAPDFARIGALIGQQAYPTVLIQEGGYRTRTIGANARHFFQGLTTAGPLRAERARTPGAEGAKAARPPQRGSPT